MTSLAPVAAMEAIVLAIGERDFFARTARALCDVASFELSAILFHRSDIDPAVLHHDFDRVEGRAGLERYARATHRSNPMLGTRRLGAVRASDFRGRWTPPARLSENEIVPAPDEELGFRTRGWPPGLEEVGLYLPLSDGLLEMGLYRERASHALPDHGLHLLDALCRPVAAALDRHRRLTAPRGMDWRSRLTAREQEIADLLLIGCSTDAIAGRLILSRHTVKDHRKHIFARLGISSLAELFALARPSHSGGISPLPAIDTMAPSSKGI